MDRHSKTAFLQGFGAGISQNYGSYVELTSGQGDVNWCEVFKNGRKWEIWCFARERSNGAWMASKEYCFPSHFAYSWLASITCSYRLAPTAASKYTTKRR
jgi:hypothetical protein